MTCNNTKFLVILIILIFNSLLSFGQSVKGIILDEISGEPLFDVEVMLKGTDFIEYTDFSGEFKFLKVPNGDYTLKSNDGNTPQKIKEFTVAGEDINLGTLKIKNPLTNENTFQFGQISLSDSELDTENGQQQVSSALSSGRDVFGNTAAFNFNAGRFRIRGYDSENSQALMNGVVMNDLDDGRPFWGTWGGLNDVLRLRTTELSLGVTPFAFGGVGGASNVNIRAGAQRAQTRASYAISNRSYRNRVMFTHSTGLNKNGWALSISGSKRWAQEGYIDATYYDGYSYFASVQKVFNSSHSLNLSIFGAPLDRGRSTGSTQEAYDLSGSNYYNPNWGYQNGEKRNSRSYKSHLPVGMLTHDWNLSEKTLISSTVMVQKGTFANTGLDWFLAPDPRPDYYRKLPSAIENPELAESTAQFFRDNPEELQLDWDKLYQINYGRNLTVENADNTGESRTGALAAYIIQAQRFDVAKYSFTSNLQHIVSDAVNIYGGLSYRREINKNFKVLEDLLGAEFSVDYDEFAIRDLPNNPDAQQSDLNNPNRIIGVGDVFGYNYDITQDYADAWLQSHVTLNSFDFFASAKISNTSFFRTGYYRNGLFPDSSFGDSETQSYLNYHVKAGVTFKLDNRNYFYANASMQTRAPFSRYAYLSPRTRDEVVPNLTSEMIKSGEVGYLARYSRLKARATAYYTKFENQLFSRSFYHDQERGFVNYIMTGVDKLHTGVELAVEAQVTSTVKLKAVAALSSNTFDSRPTATISQDNDAQQLVTDRTVYLKNYRVSGSPQTAYNVGIEYNSPKFWFATLNFNYFDDIYIDVNPDRRTSAGIEGIDKETDPTLWYGILDQEKVDPNFTVDLFGGKSFKRGDTFINLTVGISNILNNTEFITGGFEQLRFDYQDKDVNRFPTRYFYSYGTNYFIGLTVSL